MGETAQYVPARLLALMISGATYCGVPQIVVSAPGPPYRRANPKSGGCNARGGEGNEREERVEGRTREEERGELQDGVGRRAYQ